MDTSACFRLGACLHLGVFAGSLEALHQSSLSDWAVNKQLAQTVGLADDACLQSQTPKPWALFPQRPLYKNLNMTAVHVVIASSYI